MCTAESTAISSDKVNHRKISFTFVIIHILGAILKSRKAILVASILLDTLNATTRIGAVFALSLFATSLRSTGNVTILGYSIALPSSLIGKSLLAAGIVSGLFALSATFNYVSVILARRMARLLNESILTDVIAGLSVAPDKAIKTVHRPVSEFNRMLTQNGFHYGMMGESLLRMANPLILFVMACGVILNLSPMLGLGALTFSLFFIPLFAKIVSKTRTVAQGFYAEQAAEMGMGVSSAVLELSTQYGGFTPEAEYPSDFPEKPFMAKFLTAFDKNILANERMTFAVGLVGALVIFAIISATGFLYSQGTLDEKAMIAVVGAFVFLMTSTRTVASHMTNLIRFYPQVKFILEFVMPFRDNSQRAETSVRPFDDMLRNLEAVLNVSNLKQLRLGYFVGEPISKFTLIPYLNPLSKDMKSLAAHTQFINASYRFRQNAALIDLLDPTQSGDPKIVEPAAQKLGVFEEYKSLENGFNTVMTEKVWNSLTGEARSAVRLIPLALEVTPKIIFLDVGVISNLNPLSFDQVFSMFRNKVVFIVLNEQYCPDNLVDKVIVKYGDTLRVKSLDSFRVDLLPEPKLDGTSDGSFPLTAIL